MNLPGIRLTDDSGKSARLFATACSAVFAVAALIIYGPLLLDMAHGVMREGSWGVMTDRDFANYWVAGQLVLEGTHLELFGQDSYLARLALYFGPDYPVRNWSYPPHFLLFVWPLGLLGFKTGLALFLVATFAFFCWSVVVFRRTYAPASDCSVLWWSLLAYFLMMLDASQNGFLTAGLLLLGLAWMARRPLLAGAAFACLTIKPQLGVLIPVLLMMDRNWRAMGWSAVCTVLLVLVSVMMLGLQSWVAYLTETLIYQRSVMMEGSGLFLKMMPTVFGALRVLGFDAGVASGIQWFVSMGALAFLVWIWRRDRDSLRRMFYLTGGTFLVTPYAFNYDMGALAACAAILAGSESLAPRESVVVVSMVAVSSALVVNLGEFGMPITPLLITAGLGVVAAGRNVKGYALVRASRV